MVYIPPMSLATLDWQAGATLITGGLAVIAAYIVGRRQTAISAKQNEILSRQLSLDELRLKSELFDRRFEVYKATEEYLASLVAGAFVVEISDRVRVDFVSAIERSRFLFTGDVTDRLQWIFGASLELWQMKVEEKENIKSSGTYRNMDRSIRLRAEIEDTFNNLHDCFGGQLSLANT